MSSSLDGSDVIDSESENIRSALTGFNFDFLGVDVHSTLGSASASWKQTKAAL